MGIEPRNTNRLRSADVLEYIGKQNCDGRQRETGTGSARSETPDMHGNILHGNRESPSPPAGIGAAGRIGKSKDASR